MCPCVHSDVFHNSKPNSWVNKDHTLPTQPLIPCLLTMHFIWPLFLPLLFKLRDKRGILKWGMTGFLKKILFLKSDLTVPSVQRKLELQQDISTWKNVPYIFKQLLSQIKGTEPIFIPSKVDCNQCSIKCCLLLKLQQRQISRQPMTFDTRKYEDKNVRRYRFGLLR